MFGQENTKRQPLLPLELIKGLIRKKWLLFLFSFNVVSAVMVISISHQNRQETIKQEKIMEQRDALDVEWRHLLLEERALSEHYRVERLANEKLKMKRPTTDDEIFVKWP